MGLCVFCDHRGGAEPVEHAAVELLGSNGIHLLPEPIHLIADVLADRLPAWRLPLWIGGVVVGPDEASLE
jgi:hypothetical protein